MMQFPGAAVASGIIRAVGTGAQTATFNGSAVDLRDYVGNVLVIQETAAGTGTTPTLNGKVQDSDDGSTGWADITGATFTQVTTTGNIQGIAVSADSSRRFIRYVGTIGGTTPSFTMSCIVAGVKQQI